MFFWMDWIGILFEVVTVQFSRFGFRISKLKVMEVMVQFESFKILMGLVRWSLMKMNTTEVLGVIRRRNIICRVIGLITMGNVYVLL